jgi:hypothetical protein
LEWAAYGGGKGGLQGILQVRKGVARLAAFRLEDQQCSRFGAILFASRRSLASDVLTLCLFAGTRIPMTVDGNSGLDSPAGLGGWLILVGIGVVLLPFLLAFQLSQLYLPFFQDTLLWDAIDPSSGAYVPWFREYLFGSAALNLVLFGIALTNVFGFFGRKTWFPKLYITMLVFSVLLQVVDAWVAGFIVPDDPTVSFGAPEVMRGIIRSIGQALIWVPYMLISKRVENTFTR